MAGTMVKTLYDEIFEKGVFNGELKGIKKGIKKGIEKGIEKGREEESTAARTSVILRLLNKRFGEVRIDVKEKLYAKQDPIVLESLAEQLLDCKTIEEFIELL
jgi:predicted transposase YdaD